MATFTRINVWNNDGTFANTDLLWYAKGVGKMQSRALDDPTSWWFFAAIHGEYVTPESLRTRGAFPWKNIPGPPKVPTSPLPTTAIYKKFWNQCQHASWYFLPWHRGYLMALEAQIRADVIALGGPNTWSLPYWNYFGPAPQYKLPPAFALTTLPDGTPNPLFTTARYGPLNLTDPTKVWVPTADGIQANAPVPQEVLQNPVEIKSLGDTEFVGDPRAPEFGGPQTGFNHSIGTHGDLEHNPHDFVHFHVGGSTPDGSIPGLMSIPALAGLDPIFYLHHANIDRLWAVWITGGGRSNPVQPAWLNGPASAGKNEFVMPWPGTGEWTYTPQEMSDLGTLNFTYDNLQQVTSAAHPLIERLARLGVDVTSLKPEALRTMGKTTELVGASDAPLEIVGNGASTTVRLQPQAHQKLQLSLERVSLDSEPDRVFLNLQNIRGTRDAQTLSVYLNLPPGENSVQHPELRAGSIALFGLADASSEDGDHGGGGISFSLDISKAIDSLHLKDELDTGALKVTVIPNRPVDEDDRISIGKVSIFRKGS